eukprot:28100-Eustigmatos_ZCMA.PRE.1
MLPRRCYGHVPCTFITRTSSIYLQLTRPNHGPIAALRLTVKVQHALSGMTDCLFFRSFSGSRLDSGRAMGVH